MNIHRFLNIVLFYMKYDKNLIKSEILKTCCFFDIYSYPLTAFEIFNYIQVQNQFQDITLNYIEKCLDELVKQQNIYHYHGVYSISKNYKQLYQQRCENTHLQRHKITKIEKFARFLQYIPFVKAIFVCNTCAMGPVHKKSDIDLFIISQKNSVWLCRFFVILTLKLLHVRPSKAGKANKICTGFFVDESKLGIYSFAIPCDIYLFYWYITLIPLSSDNQDIIKRFYNKNNELFDTNRQRVSLYFQNMILSMIKSGIEYTLHFLNVERFLRWVQMKKLYSMSDLPIENDDQSVIISDHIIKLHKNDARSLVRETYKTYAYIWEKYND